MSLVDLITFIGIAFLFIGFACLAYLQNTLFFTKGFMGVLQARPKDLNSKVLGFGCVSIFLGIITFIIGWFVARAG